MSSLYQGIRRVTSRISPAGRPCTLATSRSAPRSLKGVWVANIAARGRGERREKDGRPGGGIAPEDVRQHVVAFVPGKIEVDVGGILALGIEKALEQKTRAERLDV